MPNLNNGAEAPALPACLNKRKAAPLQSSLSTQAGDSNKTKRNLTHRQRRALRLLLDTHGRVTVKALITETQVNNAPELIAGLRRRGLEIPCEKRAFTTADGELGKLGFYELTKSDRHIALELLGND